MLPRSLAIVILGFGVSLGANASPVNALWNDDHGFGIWLYEGPVACSEQPYQLPRFLALGPGGKHPNAKAGPIKVQGLELCSKVDGTNMVGCVTGEVEMQFNSPTGEYLGKYAITFRDGSSRSGSFRAQHCKAP